LSTDVADAVNFAREHGLLVADVNRVQRPSAVAPDRPPLRVLMWADDTAALSQLAFGEGKEAKA
jgi:hypothetical protein